MNFPLSCRSLSPIFFFAIVRSPYFCTSAGHITGRIVIIVNLISGAVENFNLTSLTQPTAHTRKEMIWSDIEFGCLLRWVQLSHTVVDKWAKNKQSVCGWIPHATNSDLLITQGLIAVPSTERKWPQISSAKELLLLHDLMTNDFYLAGVASLLLLLLLLAHHHHLCHICHRAHSTLEDCRSRVRILHRSRS